MSRSWAPQSQLPADRLPICAFYACFSTRLATLALALCAGLFSPGALRAAVPICDQNAQEYSPCELAFDWKDSELNSRATPFKDDLLHVEFRSPHAKTYLVRSFPDSAHSLRVRFTPTEDGTWKYRITSPIPRYDSKEGQFNVTASTSPGYVNVANLRHWWTDNKQPHLWLAADAPWIEMGQSEFQTWVDARKADGFTHIRGVLLSSKNAKLQAFPNNLPNSSYFAELDDRLLYVHRQGLTLDLMLADTGFEATGAFEQWDQREPLVNYLIARYGALNVCWQGLQAFDKRIGSRDTLRSIAAILKKSDTYHHPLSTDTTAISSTILPDGWANYLVEASPQPDVGAIEHQLTTVPIIHVVNATEPAAFRRELWQATMNTEYPSVSFAALQRPENVAAIKAWMKVMAGVRHWDNEPYFDVDGGTSMGVDEAEYVLYAPKPGHVEVSLPKHKYQPYWLNPINGETIDVKDYKGEVFSAETPDTAHDWVLHVERQGHKEAMLKSYKFESYDVPVFEVESDAEKTPFQIVVPKEEELDVSKPVYYEVKLREANRATRSMQYMWIGEIVAEGEGIRLLATGSKGTFLFPLDLVRKEPAVLNLRLYGMNANGKVYELTHVMALKK
jgi:Domain of unknown function (DUF5060)/Protein of unknown function (DUF4038)